jgi:hypothetical protein
MEAVVRRLGGWAFVLLFAIIAIALTPDSGFAIHMGIVGLAALIVIIATLRSYDPLARAQSIFKMPPGPSRYDDDVVRWGVIALGGIDTRYRLLDASTVLEQAALDRYAFVRSSYSQHRQNLVENKDAGKPVPAASFGQ